MFIEQILPKSKNFGYYLLGSLIVIIATFIGQIPFTIAVFAALFSQGLNFSELDSSKMMSILEPNLNLFLMLLSFAVGLLALFFVAKKIHNQTIVALTTARKTIDWKRFFFSFSIWSIFCVITVIITYYQNPEHFLINFKPLPFAILLVIGIILIPIQTSLEEYLFRGYLMQGFGVLFQNKLLPLIFTSVIFGGMHLLNPEVTKLGYIMMVYYIGTGFLLGIMTLMDDGMELALGFHAANNLVGALLVTSSWSALQTHSVLKDVSEPSAGLDVVLPVVIIYPILLFILSKKYGWKNWTEKLTGNLKITKTISHDNF
jgi:uncharacterized protein